MTRRPGGRRVLGMSTIRRVTLLLRCQPEGDAGSDAGGVGAVEGELECEDGSVRTFTGWLGLVNELERIVADPA